MKKGYFLLIDSLIALFILSVGFVLLLSYSTNTQELDQIQYYSSDLMQLLSKTKLKDSNNDLFGPNSNLTRDRWVNNLENTILEQIGEFYYRRNSVCRKPESCIPYNSSVCHLLAISLIQNVTKGLLEDQYNIRFRINNETIYEDFSKRSQEADVLLPSKRLIHGIFIDECEDDDLSKMNKLWGPYLIEVKIWR